MILWSEYFWKGAIGQWAVKFLRILDLNQGFVLQLDCFRETFNATCLKKIEPGNVPRESFIDFEN